MSGMVQSIDRLGARRTNEQQDALEKDGRYFDDSTSDDEDEAESSRPWVPVDVRTAIRRRRETAIGEARHGVIRTALKSAVEGGLHSLPVHRVDPRVASRTRGRFTLAGPSGIG